jgi:predicted ferric reductase
MKEIDTIKTVTTDKGTYSLHIDCYNKIRQEAQEELRQHFNKVIDDEFNHYLCSGSMLIDDLRNKLKKVIK